MIELAKIVCAVYQASGSFQSSFSGLLEDLFDLEGATLTGGAYIISSSSDMQHRREQTRMKGIEQTEMTTA